MKFAWDENKNRSNMIKHGIDFQFAQHVFLDPYGIEVFVRTISAEERYHFIGEIQTNVFLVVFVEYSGDEIRIISARKATKKEREVYCEHKSIF